MTNYALEDILSDIKEDDYLDDFNKADSKYDNQPAIFSYFTKDSLGISIDVSHLFGGHIEIELSYSDLVEYINKDCDVWKDFYN